MDASGRCAARWPRACNSLGLGPSFVRIDLRRSSGYSARLGSAWWRKRRTTRVEESNRRIVRRPGPPIRLFQLTTVVVTMVVLFYSGLRLTSPWPVLQCVSCSTRRNARSSTAATAVATAGMYLQSALARSTSVLRASLPCRIHWTSYTFAKCIFLEIFLRRKAAFDHSWRENGQCWAITDELSKFDMCHTSSISVNNK